MSIRKRLSLILFISAMLLLSVITACSRQNSSSNSQVDTQTTTQAPVKTELTYNSPMVVTVIEPQLGSAAEQPADRAIFSALLDTEAGTHEIKPDLAEKYEVSADGLTYTFHLRKGVKFQKGFGELKASDVVFTFKRLMDPKTASRYAVNYKTVEAITAQDDYTVLFKLKKANAAFPLLVSAGYQGGYIYSEKAVTQFGDKIGQNPIGTGPYQLEELTPSSKLILAANPDYYKGAPKITKLTFLMIADDNTAFMAFRKGEIDAMVVQTPEILDQAKAMPETVIQQIPQFSNSLLFMNTRVKPFDDVRVRQAMNYAINRDEIVKTVFGTINTPSKGFVPSVTKGFTTEGVTQYDFNPEKAKQLLTEAGYKDGFTITTKQTNSTFNQRVFTVLQAQLAKVNIKLDFQAVQLPEWFTFQTSGTAQFGWWSGVAPADIQYFMNNYYHSASFPPGTNAAYYTGIDDLLNKASLENDPNMRNQLYKQAQQKLSQDVPFIPLYEQNAVVLTNKNLKGLVPGGDYANDIRFADAHF